MRKTSVANLEGHILQLDHGCITWLGGLGGPLDHSWRAFRKYSSSWVECAWAPRDVHFRTKWRHEHSPHAPLEHLWVDGADTGGLIGWAQGRPGSLVEIVKRPGNQRGLIILACRWVIEQTIA